MKSFLSTILGIGLPLTFSITCGCSSGTSPPADAGVDTHAKHDSAPPVDTGPPPCDPSKCYAGNKCIADEKGVVGCQLPCGAQYGQTPPAGQAACPFNTTCTTIPEGTPAGTAERSICTLDKTQYKNNTGGWGAPCNPTGGIEMNPDCDSKQNFWCYARNPTDGNAYCTQYLCKSDADCRGGWWCATVNVGPNAGSNPTASEVATRSMGATITVCQPRNYCASCKTDLDCDSSTGVIEHCIADHNGTRSYCAPECSKTATESQAQADGECNNEAQCLLLDQSNYCQAGSTCVCASRARECIGDGLLCSPCMSDADCLPKGGGLCLNADYSTERFCSVPSGPKAPKCTVDSMMNLVADCPTSDEAPNKSMGQYLISCLTQADGYNPPNQCIGLRTLGTYEAYGPDGGLETLPLPLPGCWTPSM
jgi:hypothetical protein